ncbi:hypothetical protein AXF42_Ash009041 [Apostasia shenzhenica]|uniref:DUF538 domain-containing protein n=1 Tax=Apostasia shenzhenica TaxID=1088818 RepID=A0A2I0ADG1_9ASPA|nr:hypothetical protein AXF42_Ash009041 [Apostasia shenzhenica]
MANIHIIGCLLGLIGLAIVLSAAGAAGAAAAAGESIHDLLRNHGLPAGLLPKSVTSFHLDRESGLMEVHLDRPCYAKYDGFVFFNQTVRGNLSYGGLRDLIGLSQEELFLWLPVKEILVSDPSSGIILFDIGVAHKQLSLSLFESPPDCGVCREEEGRGVIQKMRQGLSAKVIGFQDQR